ncbi:MAG TPA: DUF2802 domain-containing protein [Steroidobacteraceae bacterium]|nr:DUF2802 domain-containing protein [Steroidobacteraceae bacterium]
MADQSYGILEIFLLGARAFGLFAAFAAFAWGLMRMRREHQEQLGKLLQSHNELLAHNQSLSERVAALSTMVASLPRRAEPLVEAPPPPRVHAPRRDSGVRSYETAKRLARNGASVEEIIASSGVANAEARLLRRLHASAPHDSTDTRRNNAA